MNVKILQRVILKGEIKITEYLSSKGINIIGKYFSYDKNIDRRAYENQIKLIVRTQKILLGCSFEKLERFQSVIGKDIEGYKVQMKKLKRNYDFLLDKHQKNEAEKLLAFDTITAASEINCRHSIIAPITHGIDTFDIWDENRKYYI